MWLAQPSSRSVPHSLVESPSFSIRVWVALVGLRARRSGRVGTLVSCNTKSANAELLSHRALGNVITAVGLRLVLG